MSVNLLDLAKGYMTDAVMDQAASFLGESKGATQSGLNHILPALMGGMINKADNRGGAQELFNLVTKPEMGGGLLSNLGGLFSGSQQSNETMNLGGTLLKGLMGDKLGAVVDLVSAASGMKSGSTSSLMKLALPILMSVIGKKVKSDGLGLDGFIDLLGGQKDYVAKAAPAGFMDKFLGSLGIPALGSAAAAIASGAGKTKDTVVRTADRTVDTAKETTRRVTSTVSGGDNNKGGGGFGRILPLILILGLLGLAAYLLSKGCDNKVGDAAGAVVDTTKKAGEAVVDAGEAVVDFTADGFDAAGQLAKDGVEVVEGAAGAVYNAGADMVGKAIKGFEHLGKFIKRKVGDIDLYIPEWGVENRLLNFLDKCKVSDDKTEGWMTLDRTTFETASATLSADSKAQVANLVAIMKAYPNMHIKVGGYTDSDGDDATNMTLSQNRANAVMNAIVAGGIDASRVAAEGYGENHFRCPANDTDECKAKNRRVDIRVTKCK